MYTEGDTSAMNTGENHMLKYICISLSLCYKQIITCTYHILECTNLTTRPNYC